VRWAPLLLMLAGCVAVPVPAPTLGRELTPASEITVTRQDLPFTGADGAAARRMAEAACAGQGKRLVPSIYDRFEPAPAAWVYPGGCA
jgi:hypothetical protein